jgi:hypothetical protein
MKHLEDMESYLPGDPLRGEQTLVRMLRRRVELTPDRVAVQSDAGSVTYQTIWNDCQRLAARCSSLAWVRLVSSFCRPTPLISSRPSMGRSYYGRRPSQFFTEPTT